MRTTILTAIGIAGVTALAVKPAAAEGVKPSAVKGIGPPDVKGCIATSLGCYTLAAVNGGSACAGSFASWLVGERSYQEGDSPIYAPALLTQDKKYCFRPFTEDEIFQDNRTTDDYCWSQAARCFMYIENKTMCLYALNRCGSVIGFTTEHIVKDSVMVDRVSYDTFIEYYKEMCQRASDLKFAMELEAQRLIDGDNKGKIIGGKDRAKMILDKQMAQNSVVAWSMEACEPFHANEVSDAAFKPVSFAPPGPNPQNPWMKPKLWTPMEEQS